MRDFCRSCGADIIWGLTNSGRKMPVDAEPDPDGNIRLEYREGVPPAIRYYNGPEKEQFITEHGENRNWHNSHFATCPQSAAWHRKKKKE